MSEVYIHFKKQLDGIIQPSTYRKAKSSNRYSQFKRFTPTACKSDSLLIFYHRISSICSPSAIQEENLLRATVTRKVIQWNSLTSIVDKILEWSKLKTSKESPIHQSALEREITFTVIFVTNPIREKSAYSQLQNTFCQLPKWLFRANVKPIESRTLSHIRYIILPAAEFILISAEQIENFHDRWQNIPNRPNKRHKTENGYRDRDSGSSVAKHLIIIKQTVDPI